MENNNLRISKQCKFCSHYISSYGSSGKKVQGKCEIDNEKVHENLVCNKFETYKSPQITKLKNQYL